MILFFFLTSPFQFSFPIRLVGDVLVCTGFLSYSGPFNQEFREMLMSKWQKEMKSRKIPFSSDLNVTGMLADSATVGEWNLQVKEDNDFELRTFCFKLPCMQMRVVLTKLSHLKLILT